MKPLSSLGLVGKAIVLGVLIVVYALESEIENGRMNVCISEEVVECKNEIISRMEISILTMEISMEVSSVEWIFEELQYRWPLWASVACCLEPCISIGLASWC